MNIQISKTGNLIVGHVLDVDKTHLERALRFYDSQLYLKWNPKKNEGNGLWELRRRPNEKTLVVKTMFNGSKIGILEYVESDLINHVLDIPFLNYDILNKLRQMDTWENFKGSRGYSNDMDYKRDKHDENAYLELERSQKYRARHDRKLYAEIRERFRSTSPGKRMLDTYKSKIR